MIKFKKGDVVERTGYKYGKYRGMEIGDTDTVAEDYSEDDCDLRGVNLVTYGYGHSPQYLRLVEQLPPAPTDELYFNHSMARKVSIRLSAYGGITVNTFSRQCTVTADTALQMAHDLRRMAMEIKRKEKANA